MGAVGEGLNDFRVTACEDNRNAADLRLPGIDLAVGGSLAREPDAKHAGVRVLDLEGQTADGAGQADEVTQVRYLEEGAASVPHARRRLSGLAPQGDCGGFSSIADEVPESSGEGNAPGCPGLARDGELEPITRDEGHEGPTGLAPPTSAPRGSLVTPPILRGPRAGRNHRFRDDDPARASPAVCSFPGAVLRDRDKSVWPEVRSAITSRITRATCSPTPS